MRRWLLVLLVLLLPLRGWVGEAMAGQMLQERMAQAAVVEALHGASHHGADAQHDHHGQGGGHHAAAMHPGPADAGAHGAADCGTCAACQVCSSVALSPSPPVIAAGSFSQPRPQTRTMAFTSAEALLAFKPPRG